MKIVYLRWYRISKWYKSFNKQKFIFWEYLEVKSQLKKIEDDIKWDKMLYTTNWYLQFIIKNKKELKLVKEIIENKETKGLADVYKKTLFKKIEVFNYFDEITLDFDSNFNNFSEKKQSFNYHISLIKEILEKYDFLYIKKMFISKYNDFLNYGNFQITLGYDNIVNQNININKFYEKLLKLNLYDNALNKVSQLKIYKTWKKLRRNFKENNNIEKEKIKIIELNFSNINLSKISNININKNLIKEIINLNNRNIKQIINLKNKKDKNVKIYFNNLLWNQITLNKKIYYIDLLENKIVDNLFEQLQTKLNYKRNKLNQQIINIIEELNTLEFEKICNLNNKIIEKKDLFNFTEIKNNNIEFLLIKSNFLNKNNKILQQIWKIWKEYINFLNKNIQEFKIIKTQEINTIEKLLKENNKKEIRKLLKQNNINIKKSTFYYIFWKENKKYLNFYNKNIKYDFIKYLLLKNLDLYKKQYWENNFLEKEDIKTLILQIKKDIEKETLQHKKIKFLSEKFIYISNIKKIQDKFFILEKKLNKKNKLTLKKFYNIIIKELDIFKELYNIKWFLKQNFWASFWTIKNIWKKWFSYFKNKFSNRKMKFVNNKNNKKTKKNYNNNSLLKTIKDHIKNNADKYFYEGNRYNVIVYTVKYITSISNKIRNDWKKELSNKILNIIQEIPNLLWYSKFENYINTHNFNIEKLVLY